MIPLAMKVQPVYQLLIRGKSADPNIHKMSADTEDWSSASENNYESDLAGDQPQRPGIRR